MWGKKFKQWKKIELCIKRVQQQLLLFKINGLGLSMLMITQTINYDIYQLAIWNPLSDSLEIRLNKIQKKMHLYHKQLFVMNKKSSIVRIEMIEHSKLKLIYLCIEFVA